MKVMQCSLCKNQVFVLHDSGAPMTCCGETMKKIKAGSVDAAVEKHVPAVTVNGNTLEVVIGDVVHPMVTEHYIMWIAVEQNGKTQFVMLSPDDEPKASFTIDHTSTRSILAIFNISFLFLFLTYVKIRLLL